MDILNIGLILITIVILSWIYVLIKFSKKINNKQKVVFIWQLNKIIKWSDYKHNIIQLDILLDKILLKLWYKWSLWEKMKKYGNNFKNQNNIWYAHKVRNKIVHEIDYYLSRKEYGRIENHFKIEINSLLK